MDSFCCICTKYICNCRKNEEVVTLLRSYAKQISINAMKKIGAPLLGLAKYIYYLYHSSKVEVFCLAHILTISFYFILYHLLFIIYLCGMVDKESFPFCKSV